MSHTPGPWKAGSNGGTWGVCRVSGSEPVVWKMGGIPHEADARLIAAAPELLEACKALLDAGPDSCGCGENGHACGWPKVKRQAEHAITKAESKATV